MERIVHHPQFFTATILEWKMLLKQDKYKDILVDSMRFLVREGRVSVYGFSIMSNHLHMIWQMREGRERKDVQRDFLKFTAQTIQLDLRKNHPAVLKHFEVNLKDRKFQIWERNPLSVDVYTREVLLQKLNYIHHNPVKAGLCLLPEEYFYSSAAFYMNGDTGFEFLTHYAG